MAESNTEFKCPNCDFTAKNKGGLTRHKKKKHQQDCSDEQQNLKSKQQPKPQPPIDNDNDDTESVASADTIIIDEESLLPNKWIKLIDFKQAVEFDKYTRKSYFIPVANIIKDEELNDKGVKKRATV